jgi:DNA segregation ATPase FtsK/SpoIIIE, S-DNA-T family
VPNANIGTVDLRSLMESEAFRKINEKSPLAFALGKDVSGTPICADLGRMPHLLIAGTTGSGKSVCISAITLSLVMNNRPEDLKLVMIDPKMVELSRFAGLPHIIGKPESDMERLPAVLKWVVNEMERRYKKFSELGSRNLADYNDAMKRREEEPLPRIVVLIDELADMMMQSPIETEKQICRLAQMARATGIHMVVATQRPSVDVVTGLIKANFPARISFAVASSTDSRVILDQVGAESLLGRGDMLFQNPETGQPQRIQGCFVSDREVEMVIKWWKSTMESEQDEQEPRKPKARKGDATAEAEYVAHKKPEPETPWDLVVAELAAERAQAAAGKGGSGSSGGMGDEGGDDDLIQKAMEIIRNQGNVSTSLLQRKLRIGYPRAARLMEELQEMGYVGAKSSQAGKGREVKSREEEGEE